MCVLVPHPHVTINDPHKPMLILHFVWGINGINVLYFGKYELTLYLLNQNMRYLVSVHPNKAFQIFTFNPDSDNFCNLFSLAFKWSMNYCLVITSALSLYSCTIPNLLKSLEIFSQKIQGLSNNPIGSFWYLYFPHWSTIVPSYLDTVDN